MFRKLVLTAFALLSFVHFALADDFTFTGDVTYRERIALPADAELWVSLVSLPGGSVIASAAAPVGSRGGVPLQFTLDVRSNVVEAGGLFGLVAEIRSDGRTLFRNAPAMPVDIPPAEPTLIIVSFSPEPAPTPVRTTVPEVPSNSLLDTAWTVTSVGGKPVLPETRVTLSIAPDHRAGGHGGCNNFFTEADFEASPLSFGAVAATRMACAPDVMDQEAALFAALDATSDYRQEDGAALQLLDAAGVPLVGLVRRP